jgi:hypothetical protein
MVPSAYDPYFAAAATAAAALIGLLFVAVSVREQTIFGDKATAGGEPLAITAFTGLVNAFIVSLLALLPDTNIGVAATVMALISLVAIVRLHRRLHMPRRQRLVSAITVLAYGAQLGYALVLLAKPHDSGEVANVAFITFATLVISLQRAWSLLKGKHLADQAPASADYGRRTSGPGGASH